MLFVFLGTILLLTSILLRKIYYKKKDSDDWRKSESYSTHSEVVLDTSNTLEYDYFFRGGVKLIFIKDLSKVGVSFDSSFKEKGEFMKKYNLIEDDQYSYPNFKVFRFLENMSDEERKELVQSMKTEKYINVIGDLLIHPDNNSTSIILDRIIVHWKESDYEKINSILKEKGLEELNKEMSSRGNKSILKVNHPSNYRVVDVCNELVASGTVHSAEPDLYSPLILDNK